MPTEIPAQAVVAIATVIAALITGVIAMVNLTLGKELKVSEMRQAWIDALRNDLAEFFTGVSVLSTAAEQEFEKDRGIEQFHKISDEAAIESYAEVHRSLSRIKLRLNPDEAAHIKLETLLMTVLDEYNSAESQPRRFAKNSQRAATEAGAQARVVLKQEWERVKQGEPAFAALRKWVTPTLILLSSIFVAVILFARFK
jgi:hypothetical protein